MKLLAPLCVSSALLLAGCGSQTPDLPKSPGTQEVTFDAGNGKKVFADLYSAPKKATAVVLMFHQAHSSAAEYYTIAPMLKNLGLDGLAVDQRSGGDEMFGKNRTADQYSGSPSYMDAYADIEAALKWAEGRGYKKIIAWGSSYSASFMFRLASEHKDVTAVIAFSPGEYFDDKGIVVKWASGVSVPVMAVCQESEKPDVTAILNAKPAGAAARTLYSDEKAIHGSSTLLILNNPKGAGEYRKDVITFLRGFTSGTGPKPGKPSKPKH